MAPLEQGIALKLSSGVRSFAKVFAGQIGLGLEMNGDCPRDTDTARLCQRFQAGRDIQPVAMYVVTFDDDVINSYRLSWLGGIFWDISDCLVVCH